MNLNILAIRERGFLPHDCSRQIGGWPDLYDILKLFPVRVYATDNQRIHLHCLFLSFCPLGLPPASAGGYFFTIRMDSPSALFSHTRGSFKSPWETPSCSCSA